MITVWLFPLKETMDKHVKDTVQDTSDLGSAGWMYYTQLLHEIESNISVKYDIIESSPTCTLPTDISCIPSDLYNTF